MGFLTSFVMGVILGGIAAWRIAGRNMPPRRRGSQVVQDRDHLHGRQVQPAEAQRRQEPRTAAADPRRPWAANRETASSDSTAVIMMDRLEHIAGIGPAVARRLNQAGILTYADLAAQSPERVQALVSPGDPLRLQVHDWIARARTLADNEAWGERQNAS